MRTGEKLFKFLASLMLQGFYGTVIIRFESGKATHVETETRRMWQYGDLPEQIEEAGALACFVSELEPTRNLLKPRPSSACITRNG